MDEVGDMSKLDFLLFFREGRGRDEEWGVPAALIRIVKIGHPTTRLLHRPPPPVVVAAAAAVLFAAVGQARLVA